MSAVNLSMQPSLDTLGNYQIYYWSKKEDEEFQKIFNHYKISGPSVGRFNAQKLDLSKTLDERVYFPVPRYSVKEVGAFLGYQRKEQEIDATDAMALYFEYLETGNRNLVDKVIRYNSDDCLAMVTIKDWLVANAS